MRGLADVSSEDTSAAVDMNIAGKGICGDLTANLMVLFCSRLLHDVDSICALLPTDNMPDINTAG